MAISPAAVDPVTLTSVTKTATSGGWDLVFQWSGGLAPYTAVASADPSFQQWVATVADDVSTTSFQKVVKAGDPNLFFNVVGGQTVSPAVQGMGYDPAPAPEITGASPATVWWGGDVTLSGSYLDPIAPGNVVAMLDLPVKAHSVTLSADGRYATAATFTVPDDARSFFGLVEAHGRVHNTAGIPQVVLSPPVGPYTAITGVSWSPVDGTVFVAAQGVVQDIDLFQQAPAVATVGGSFTKPYISRVTQAGAVLVIEGASGVSEIQRITCSGGSCSVAHFADTHDDHFSNAILPVGLAVDPDGTVAYVADANSGHVIRIPEGAGPGSSTITDRWGGRDFTFADPCGIDVAPTHQVMVADDGTQWVWELTGSTASTSQHWAGTGVHALEVDRDVSTSSYVSYVISNELGMAEAFNLNAVGTNAARFHGGRVFGLAGGTLALDPDWGVYPVYHH
ncbi:MAG: hypothetical protein GXP48_08045, partial [Acidobacteria bacterium]|nr:hypothetical protein [Acidobacteriota bacterium]